MSWSCESCGRVVTTNQTICDRCGAAAPGADPRQVNLALQRDRIMEGHLMALALWHRIGAILVGVLALGLLIGGGALFGIRHGELDGAIGSMMAVVAVILILAAAFSYVLGHFIARLHAWARITAGVFAAIGLASNVLSMVAGLAMTSRMSDYGGGGFGFSSGPSVGGIIFRSLLSIAWSASIVWVFFNRRSSVITSPDYKLLVAQTPDVRPTTYKSPFFLIPLVLLALVALLLLVGFLLMTSRG
jgi:hypothetical protein